MSRAQRLATRALPAISAFAALSLVAGLVNYVSNIVFARILSPQSFGDFTALLALVVIVAVPTAAAQTRVAENLAALRATGQQAEARSFSIYAISHIALYALLVGLAYALTIPIMVPVLDLAAWGPAVALTPLVSLTFLMPVVFGVLQGFERFLILGVLICWIAVSRLVIGIPWTLAGGGAGGPIIGQTIGGCIALLAAFLVFRQWVPKNWISTVKSGARKVVSLRSLAASGAFVAFALLSSADLLWAKVFLTPTAAGGYAVLATVEKMVMFLPAAVAIAMVPYLARTRGNPRAAARVLRTSSFAVIGGSVFIAIPAIAVPELFLSTVFGSRYAGLANGVLPIVVAGAALSVLYLLVTYTVAIQDHRWVYLLGVAVAVQSLAIVLIHKSPTQIASVQAAVMIVVLIINEALFHPILRMERLLKSTRTEI